MVKELLKLGPSNSPQNVEVCRYETSTSSLHSSTRCGKIWTLTIIPHGSNHLLRMVSWNLNTLRFVLFRWLYAPTAHHLTLGEPGSLEFNKRCMGWFQSIWRIPDSQWKSLPRPEKKDIFEGAMSHLNYPMIRLVISGHFKTEIYSKLAQKCPIRHGGSFFYMFHHQHKIRQTFQKT